MIVSRHRRGLARLAVRAGLVAAAIVTWTLVSTAVVLVTPVNRCTLFIQDTLLVGDAAPSFVMDDLATGDPVFLSDFTGRTLRQPWKNSPRQVVVLCFWSSWSDPSVKEIDELSRIAGNFSGKPVTVFLVDTKEHAGTTAQAIQKIVEERGYRLRVLMDATGTVADRYSVHTVPSTFVVNKYGVLKMSHHGPGIAQRAGFESLLSTLAEEP